MEAVIALAERLGKEVANSPQATALRDARDGFDDDTKAAWLEFRRQTTRVAQLQQENKPIEVDDKHKLQELQNKLVASDTFKKFTAAQVEYVDLMRKVDAALRGQLGDIEGDG